jgi:hypothetical protein
VQQPWYATREQVKSALDTVETARNNAQIDRAIASASRSIERQMARTFYPFDGTRYFGFPRRDMPSWKLWLDGNDLISVTSLSAGGVTIAPADYFLEPVNVGPPYTSIEIDQSSSAVFASGDTAQRSIQITGTFGYWEELEAVGTLFDALDASASDTATITWTDPAKVGVGSILKIDSERVIVTDMSFVDSTQNTGGALTASAADVTVTVTDGTGFFVGETIRIDSERLYVVDTSATTLTVKRAWDGSVLAAHNSGADVYGRTGIQITRAALGTTLAAHTSSDVVYRWVVPPLINDLCLAEAVVQLQTEQGGYARTEGELSGKPAVGGLRALREQTYDAYGRKVRARAI